MKDLLNKLVAESERLGKMFDGDEGAAAQTVKVRAMADAFNSAAKAHDATFKGAEAPSDEGFGATFDYAVATIEAASKHKPTPATRRSAPANGGIGHIPDGTQRKANMGTFRPNSYGALFADKVNLEQSGGFESSGQFLRHAIQAIGGKGISPLLASHTEGGLSSGGFLVPHQFLAQDLDPQPEVEVIMPRADVYPMVSESLSIAGVSNIDETGSTLFGGFKASWIEEGGEFPVQDMKTRKMTLRLKKCGLLSKASNELLEDSMFQSKLTPAMRIAIADARDEAFINGTGVGQPRGLLRDPAKITVSKEDGQAADTIRWANIAKMFMRLHPRLVQGAVWIANPTVWEQLLTLSIPLGTGAESRPATMNADGTLILMGKPVLMTSKAPVLGDEGDLILANLSQYAVGLGPDIRIDSSGHVGFSTDETYFRVRLRADGQGKWERPFTPRKGTSFSWLVTLEAR